MLRQGKNMRMTRTTTWIESCLALLVVVAALGCGDRQDVGLPGYQDDPGTGGETPPPAGETYAVTLSWDAPTTNADGTPLGDLAGYKVYDGGSAGSYTMSTDVGNVTTATLEGYPEGTYYFTVVAYDTSGNESDYSNEVVATLPIASPPALALQ
jgi:hypothetical protein